MNKNSNTAFTIIAVIAFMTIAGILAMNSIEKNASNEFSITYVTGCECDNDFNPEGYDRGDFIELVPISSSEGYFGGWYLDDSYTQLCMYITPDMSGNVTLYAKWQNSMEGRELTFTFKEQVHDGYYRTYTMYGERTVTYKDLDEFRGYFINYDSYITYDYGDKKYSASNEFGLWNPNMMFNNEFSHNERIDTIYGNMECAVLVYTEDDYLGKLWVGVNDDVIYKAEENLGQIYGGTVFTYELEDYTVTSVKKNFNLTAYADSGITVSGSGTYKPDTNVVLEANVDEGTEFAGWFDSELNLLTEETVLEVNTGWIDKQFYALNSNEPDYEAFTYNQCDIDLETDRDVKWKVCPYGYQDVEFSGNTNCLNCTFVEPGWYEVYIDGDEGYHGYRSMFVDGYANRLYTWTFENKAYSYELKIDYEDVLYYFVLADEDQRCGQLTPSNWNHDLERSFVTYDDPYIVKIAEDFNVITEGMDEVHKTNFVLMFLQSIEYQSDDVFIGVTEYWKYPLETLFDMGGDCEDSSILYAAIMKAMGFDSALVLFPDHVMAAVHIDKQFDGCEYFVDNLGHRYYYIESTSNYEDFGKLPEGVDIKNEIPVFI